MQNIKKKHSNKCELQTNVLRSMVEQKKNQRDTCAK